MTRRRFKIARNRRLYIQPGYEDGRAFVAIEIWTGDPNEGTLMKRFTTHFAAKDAEKLARIITEAGAEAAAMDPKADKTQAMNVGVEAVINR